MPIKYIYIYIYMCVRARAYVCVELFVRLSTSSD